TTSESDRSKTGTSSHPEFVNQVSINPTMEKDVDEQSSNHDNNEDNTSDASSEIPDIANLKDLPDILHPNAISPNIPFGLSRPWGFSSYDDFDVITVHGIRDDHKTVWKSQTGTLWLKDKLFHELSVRQLDYHYAVDNRAGIFGPNGIKLEAWNLLRSYCQHRRSLPDTEVNRPVIWIGHDIGGTIVKQALMEAAQPLILDDYTDIPTWESTKEIHHAIATLSTTIICLGCPHKSESMEILEDEVLNLMTLPGPEIPNDRLGKIKNIARQIEDINIHYLKSRLFHRLTTFNVFHLMDIPEAVLDEELKGESVVVLNPTNNTDDDKNDLTSTGVAQPDQVYQKMPIQHSAPTLTKFPVSPASPFSRYTLTTYNSMEVASRFRVKNIDHASLVRGDEKTVDVENWVVCLSNYLHENIYPFKIDQSFIRSQTALLSVIPPMRIPTIHMQPEKEWWFPTLRWIASQDICNSLDKKLGPQLLHVEADEQDPRRVALLSQYLYTLNEHETVSSWDEDPKGRSFYFEFVRSDQRYNNIRSMLLTFISHAAWHYSHDSYLYHVQTMLSQLENYRFWSLTHLFQLFSTFRSWTNASRLVIFLGSFDECIEDDRRWFLDALKEDQSRGDIDYCVVITTGGSDEISKSLINESKTISLAKCPEPFLGYDIDEKGVGAHGLNLALEHTIQKRPVLQKLKPALLGLLDDCRNVPCYGYVILQWLDNFRRGVPLANIVAAVERLRPVTAETISKGILGGLSDESRDWAFQVYHWVRYTKEPLNFKTLGQVLLSSQNPEDVSTAMLDYDYKHLKDELQRCFSGIIVIESGEVKFSHDSFDQAIASTIDDSETTEPSRAHGSIAKTCLQYMMQDCTRQQFARLSVDNYGGDELKYPTCNSEQDLLEYAVQFWVFHYRLAGMHRPLELALSFFHAKDLRDRWAEATYLLSNPFTRIQRSYLSPLPLMACFGLEDLVSVQVVEDKKSHWYQQDILLAIVEAVRNDHISIFRYLFALVEADEATLKDAMVCAAAAQDEEIMINILDKVASFVDFHWTQSLLSCAAITGSRSLVAAIATAGFNLNKVDEETGQTALHSAIFWGQREIVGVLLGHEIDLSMTDNRDMTPFELAVEMADPEIVQMLLEKGAKVDERTEDGDLIAMRAAELGHHMVLDRLISAGAQFQVEATDTETTEPIILAVQQLRKECIFVLLEHGANPCATSSEGSLLYQCLNRYDTIDICNLLLEKGANPNETFSDREMLLIAGVRTDDTELVGLLIDHGANINSIDPWEEGDARTPLAFAASQCTLEMMEFLLDRGADVNYVPEGANSALYSAALEQWNTDRLESLLKRGAKIDWRRDNGWQALHAAYDAPDSVKVLLQHGADINAICVSGTVTMMAARWGFKGTLEVLVSNQESPPNLNAKLTYDPDHEDYGTTAVRLAAQAGKYDCASFLLESGALLDDDMMDAKFFIAKAPENMSPEQTETCVKLVEQCVERGTRTNILDDEQNSVLHLIKKTTPVSLVSVLISLGAPMDNTNADGWTPLAVALRERNLPVANLLLSIGARADISSPKFGSLLHIACDWHHYAIPSTEIYRLLKLLIQRKADPKMPGPEPRCEPILFTAIRHIPFPRASEMIARYLVEEVKVDINLGGRAKTYPIFAAAAKSHYQLLNYFIRHGADLEIADDQGLLTCHYAAMRRGLAGQMLKFVFKSSNPFQARDDYDRTPLHFASTNAWRDSEMVLKRLPNDFNVNVKDCDGWTPLMWACRWKDSWETAQHLVQDYGADIWAVSNDGQWSPLKLAYFAGIQEQFEGILEPPEDGMERVLEDGSKQVWDTAFHRTLPGKHHPGRFCTSCLMPIVGPLYLCVDCQESICFKCFPHRKTMHDPAYEMKEVKEPGSSREEKDGRLDSDDAADDDDELETDGDDDGVENNEDDDDVHEEEEDDDDDDEEPLRI
ncbi:unnamed protein product, partial [Fusarium graminearum]